MPKILVLVVVISIVVVGLLSYLSNSTVEDGIRVEDKRGDTGKDDIPNGGQIAICIDCVPGHIGGGCTYTDKNTGVAVQPKECVTYDTTKTKSFCVDTDRNVDGCIEIYQPVCGNDARTYANSCFSEANFKRFILPSFEVHASKSARPIPFIELFIKLTIFLLDL